jgi:polyisoprenyl-phosphate glycosyltransferase
MELSKTPHISVVIPVYGCKTCLVELYLRLKKTMETITQDFEIIMINDASPDGAWETIIELVQKDPRVKGIDLSRNFGQHYAITAGLDHCSGDWVVVMDCDLQDQPEEIIKLYNHAIQINCDIVFGKRKFRKDSFFKRTRSRIFYTVLNYFTDKNFESSVSNFSIARKTVIEAFCQLKEQNRAYPLFLRWLGYRYDSIEVNHSSRVNGKSSYSLNKLFRLAFDIIISNSNKPLRIIVTSGFITAFLSFIVAIILIVMQQIGMIRVTGWTGIMVSLWFIFGILLSVLGVIGLYIGKIFDETKNKPLYIIKNKTF